MSIFRRSAPRRSGLDDVDLETLATYNAERWRGIVHTPEWDERMAELQRRFDVWRAREWDAIEGI